MHAAVSPEINAVDDDFVERNDRALEALGVAGKREDGSVVRRVSGIVEQPYAGHLAD